MNRNEWKLWLDRFRKPLSNEDKSLLDESLKLKEAVEKGDYKAAETIAFEIVFDLRE